MIRIKKYIIICLLVVINIMILNAEVLAATVGSFNINLSSNSIFVGETSNLTITVSNCEGLFVVNSSNPEVISVSSSSEWIDSSKAITLTAKASGTATITITPENVADNQVEPEDVNGSKTVTITVNEKPVTPAPKPEPEPEPTPNPEPETPTVEEAPNFIDTNKTMYASKDNMNLRARWSITSEATKVDKGTKLTVIATSTNLIDGYVWYRVTYNGKTLYVASSLLTDTKPEEGLEEQVTEENEPTPEPVDETTEPEDENEVKEGLSSLEIEGITLTPTFSPNIYEYKAIIKEDLSELVINAIPVIEGATITVAGNKNITEGQNLITIIVYNANGGVEATYQVTVNKNTLDLSSIDEILKIGNKDARRNLMIFIALLAVSLVALIVVMVLKHRNTLNEDDYEEEELYSEEFANSEQNVENTEKETTQEEIEQEEIQRPRRDKRKGKHF